MVHPWRPAIPRQLVDIHAVNARALVLVFDLTTTVFDADVHAEEGLLLVLGKRIAQPAERDGQIARRFRAGIEVLMEHAVRGREDGPVLPVESLEVRVAFIPVDAVAVAGHGKDMK